MNRAKDGSNMPKIDRELKALKVSDFKEYGKQRFYAEHKYNLVKGGKDAFHLMS